MKRDLVVALIGRPNVGKSSLFNRLIKRQNKALAYDLPGVTRDRHYGITTFNDLGNIHEEDVILVDTGGFYPQSVDETNGTVVENTAGKFFNIMADSAKLAIEESDLVLLVVDVREGLLPFDQTIVNYIRSQKKDFLVLINKFDSSSQEGSQYDFYSLGIEEEQIFTTSAAHGLGLDDLRKRIHQYAFDFSFKKDAGPDLQLGVTPREEVVAKVSLIGAPNAGKSTLLNMFIGAERALVSNIPGTTVDPIEGFFDLYFGENALELKEKKIDGKSDNALLEQYERFRKNNPNIYNAMTSSFITEEESIEGVEDNIEFLESGEVDLENTDDLDTKVEQVFNEEDIPENPVVKEKGSLWRSIHVIDTAGIRRQKSISGHIEEQSVYRSLRCISESDVVLYMIDATKGIGHQDRRLLDVAIEKGKSVIVVLNKMDLMAERLPEMEDKKEWIQSLKDSLPWLTYCDLVPVSAKKKTGINKLKKILKKTILIRNAPVPTGMLNRAIFDLVERHSIVVKKSGGKRLKVKYVSQIKTDPPTFLLFTNKSNGIPENYRRYLKNGIRDNFGLDNTPIHLLFRTGSDLEKRMKKARPSTN